MDFLAIRAALVGSLLLLCLSCKPPEGYDFLDDASSTSIVQRFGSLKVKGNQIVGQNDQAVQVRGMSLFWSQWAGQFWNPGAVKTLATQWKSTVIRAAMGVEEGGYLADPDKQAGMVRGIVNAAIENGIYVIIDYHAHYAHKSKDQAIKFFTDMAKEFGNKPNVIFELFNEPKNDVSWEEVKAYAEAVTKAIRDAGSKNLVIVGTRTWSQEVDVAANNPVNDPNVAYTLHFYADTHKQELRDKGNAALAKNVALFVTEFGVCAADGNGNANFGETDQWMKWMDEKKISWANWALNDKPETSSALQGGADPNGNWDDSKLTQSGQYVKKKMIEGAAKDPTGPAIVATNTSSSVATSSNTAASVSTSNMVATNIAVATNMMQSVTPSVSQVTASSVAVSTAPVISQSTVANASKTPISSGGTTQTLPLTP